MRLPQSGGCQCGAIRYEVSEAPLLVYTCHCRECQRLTGSAFSMALVTNTEVFSLMGPAPRPLQRKPTAGARSPGGSARIAARGSGAARSPTRLRGMRSASEPARWTTPLGCVRPRISGPAARSAGSSCPKGIRASRPSPKAWIGCSPLRSVDRGKQSASSRSIRLAREHLKSG
jgi:hypothetical protein